MSDFIPIEIVERLSKQGLTEMEIVSQLKLRGFREDQINSAVNEAIKQGVVGKPGVPARPYVDANEQNLDIPRHPENALQPQHLLLEELKILLHYHNHLKISKFQKILNQWNLKKLVSQLPRKDLLNHHS